MNCFGFQNALHGHDPKQLVQAMTSHQLALPEADPSIPAKGRLFKVTDDVNTESYHTSGSNPCHSIDRFICLSRGDSNDEQANACAMRQYTRWLHERCFNIIGL